jgi:hypothetical protein
MVRFKLFSIGLLFGFSSFAGDPVLPTTGEVGDYVYILRIPLNADNQWAQPSNNPYIITSVTTGGVIAKCIANEELSGELLGVWKDFWTTAPPTNPTARAFTIDKNFGIENNLGLILGAQTQFNVRMLFNLKASSYCDPTQMPSDKITNYNITLAFDDLKLLEHNIPLYEFKLGENNYRFKHLKLQSIQERAIRGASYQWFNTYPSEYNVIDFKTPYQGVGYPSQWVYPMIYSDISYRRKFFVTYEISFYKEAWHGEKTETGSSIHFNFDLNTQY